MKDIPSNQIVETAEQADTYLLTHQSKIMDRTEFENLIRDAEKELALERVMLIQEIDKWYSDVITISFGTQKSIMDARKQLEERRNELAELELNKLRDRIEAKYFGDFGSRHEALRAIEAAETQARLEIATSEKRTPRGVLMRLRARLTSLL